MTKQQRQLIFQSVMVVLLVVGGVTIVYKLNASKPEKKRRPAERQARLVRVEAATQQKVELAIHGMGLVRPARSSDLAAQVGGRIVYVGEQFSDGAMFAKGDELLRIESSDYEIAIKQAEAELVQRRSTLVLEEGNRAVAEREFALLEEDIPEADKNLILREPQLASARAQVQAAEARLERARLDLSRCRLTAPFDGMILQTQTELGASLSPNARVAEIVATDAFWIEVLVPERELYWLRRAVDAGTEHLQASITHPAAWGPDVARVGRVLRVLPRLEEQGRMAKVLVEVQDPMRHSNEQPRLLLGSFVSVGLGVGVIKEHVVIPRQLLRQDDHVWVMTDESTLAVRPVTVLWRDREQVVITSGLTAGEQVVSSHLSAPVNGMALRQEAAVTSDGRAPGPDSQSQGQADDR